MNDNLEYLRIHMALADELGKYYINSTPIFRLGDLDIYVHDAAAAAIISGTATYLIGTRGSGKTLLAEAVYKAVMNGDALYLRGDKDLNLKDLYTKLNLEGKDESEIYSESERIKYPFVLADEINRCIAMVMNQFLNIADGYIEIRGKKIKLGIRDLDYCLMFATGNPPNDGEDPGVFDEPVPLLDRIKLVINVNDYPLNEDDTATIKERRINKDTIQENDMREDVFLGNRLLKRLSGDMLVYFSILAAHLDKRFRFVDVGGKLYDKTKVDWRNILQEGSHGSGEIIAWASDISQRAQQENRLAEAFLLYYMGFKGVEDGNPSDKEVIETLPPSILIEAYLETLMLNLRYDRRFLPAEYIAEQHHGDAKEYLDAVKASLMNEINPEVLEQCVGSLIYAREALDKGDQQTIQNHKRFIESSFGTDPIARTAIRILDQRMAKRLLRKRRGDVSSKMMQMLKRQ